MTLDTAASSTSRPGPAPPESARRPDPTARAGPGAAAVILGGSAALAAGAASVAGLVDRRVYEAPLATATTFQAWDLVTLLVAPGLLVALWRTRRGSRAAGLAATSLLAYLVYTYAYYAFGTGFNDLFLLHVAVLGLSGTALVATVTRLDVAGSAARCGRAQARAVAVSLGLLGLALAGMWAYHGVHNAVTGEVPVGSVLVETDQVVHLGMALDLAFLVPLYAAAAVLLWRRRDWGFALATVALAAGVLHQVGYLLAMPWQVAAEVPGSTAFDPGEPFVVAVYVGAALALWWPRRRRAPV